MNYTCKETCNMDKPCKNKHCSANPKYIPPKLKEVLFIGIDLAAPRATMLKKEKK